MYTQHFGLTQDPFSIAPDPRFLFMSQRHREALAHLLYGVGGDAGAGGGAGGGFVLLTGDIGAGKTTICRCFLAQIPAGCQVAYIFNPKLSVLELLQSICDEFHITLPPAAATPPSGKTYMDALNTFLLRQHASGQSCVLIIDEAQNLSSDVLEQLRLLTNLETSERKLLQIVLIGQPELRTLLASPKLEQLAQRVVARFHLDALNAPETTHYITHRLAVAGHSGALPFEPKALARIHQLTHGVPRRINLLCGRALLGAWASGKARVTVPVVNQAATEVFGDSPKSGTNRLIATVLPWLLAIILIASSTTTWLLWPTPATPAAPARQASASSPTTPASSAPAGASSVTQPASQPSPPASAAASPPTAELEDLGKLWPSLAPDLNTTWRELASVWNLPALSGDPCTAAATHQLLCYQTKKLTLLQVRQLGRMGIVTLQSGQTPPVHAVLLGLSETSATLQVAGQRHVVGLMALSQAWSGDFATYWKPPPGFSQATPKDGAQGPTVALLVAQLTQLNGQPLPHIDPTTPTLNPALRQHISAFQQAHGLQADGQPGSLTFMQLERALGLTQARLHTE